MKLTRNQLIINAVVCLTLLIVVVWALYSEYDRPWKKYQKEKIQQLYLQDLGQVDRCITCHQGSDKSDISSKPQPFSNHSGDYLKHHKIEKFGCVACHEGQGAALTVNAAHGNVENWPRPILSGPFAQASCSKCHAMNQGLPLNVELKDAMIFVGGWKLFNEYNCIGCHKLAPYERPEYIAPSLQAIGNKVNRDWLINWLKNPTDYLPKTKMPRFNLSEEEIGDMADYLLDNKNNSYLSFPLSKGRTGGFNEGGISNAGKKLVAELGCLGCHAINNNGSDFAPDLSDIGSKVNADWLFQFLINPKAYQAQTPMPNLMIADKDIQSIAVYLMSLKKNKQKIKNPSSSPSLAKKNEKEEKGIRLIKEKGCTGCHKIEKLSVGYDAPALDGIGSKRIDELVFGNITNVNKTLTNWLMIKVRNPESFARDRIITRMPDYSFNEKQAKMLTTFLLSIKNESISPAYKKTLLDPDRSEMRGMNILEKYNCTGCHKLNNKGGSIGPDITKEAEKSRSEWLFAFLKKPFKIRPEQMLKAKMPEFNLPDKEINSIIAYLSSVSAVSYPYSFMQKKEVRLEDIHDGEKLYHEVFACNGCHSVNGFGGQIGPDHTDVSSRLSREWIERWLKDPQAMQPDVKMPRFKFKDWEFEALTNYLMTLGEYRFMQIKKSD